MEKENRLYAFLVSKYGVAVADKAMINFADKQKKYVEKPKQ
jgi:hypothetical protein